MILSMIFKLIALLLPIVFWCNLGFAITYYVDSATGNDSWDGKTSTHAWATVAGGNQVNFTDEDRVHIKQANATWRIYDAPDRQSQTLASTIITNVRSLLNETTESFFTDAEMLAWVNAGIQDIAARTNCSQTTETDTLVDGQLYYSIGTEYLAVKQAVYRQPTITFGLLQENGDTILQENGDGILIQQATANGYKGLALGSYQNLGHEEDIKEPAYWYVWKDQVGYYPLTGSVAAGNNVILYLISRPYPVTLGANIPLPSLFDYSLVLYVAAQGFKKDRKFMQAHGLITFYHKTLDRFRVDFARLEDPENITR